MKRKRILPALLAGVLLAGMLAGCKKENPVEPTDSTGPAETSLYDENGYLNDSLPKLNYQKDVVRLLHWTDVVMPEFVTEENGAVVDDAIYRRNAIAESRLGVLIQWIGASIGSGANGEFMTKIQKDALNEQEYDIYAGYSQWMTNVAYTGHSLNLMDVSYLDFEKPWWPDSLTSEAMVGDNLYFVSGDIASSTLYWMYATFFNKDMIETYGLENPYDLVDDNRWTLDKMFEMCRNLYVDRGDPGKNLEDTLGIVVPRLSIDAYFYGAGLTTTEKGENGELLVSPSYTGEVSQALAEKLVELLFKTDDGLCVHDDTGPCNQAFAMGNVLFITNRPLDAVTDYGDGRVKYGVVPTPKWSESQERYLTCIGNPFTLYSISRNLAEKPERANEMGAVVECLASEAYRNTTPVIFETTMKIRYAKDEVTSRMYDLIRENIVFDAGRLFGVSVNNLTQTKFRGCVETGNSGWQVEARKFIGSLEIYLELIYDEIGK